MAVEHRGKAEAMVASYTVERDVLGRMTTIHDADLLRLPAAGKALIEEAWSLTTRTRVAEASGYVLLDARGSVLAKMSGASAVPVAEEAEYGAWGESTAISGLPKPKHGFTGQEADPGTGLYHFGVRTYDPTLRRWLTPDPALLMSPQGDLRWGTQLDLYAYAGNNPVGHVDRGGEWAETALDVASVVADTVEARAPL